MIPFNSDIFCSPVAPAAICDALGAKVDGFVSVEVTDISKNKLITAMTEIIPLISDNFCFSVSRISKSDALEIEDVSLSTEVRNFSKTKLARRMPR